VGRYAAIANGAAMELGRRETLVRSGFHAVVDLVVVETQQAAVFDAGRAAVGLVPDVVDLAGGGGLVAPAGLPAVPVPQEHRVADPGRDTLAEPDVQRQARPGQPGAELLLPQEAGQPARTR
jgi:hypothetical protein